MEPLSTKLRERAAQLGVSNAEIARRLGLTERRYAHYVTGGREPDLATLVRIAKVLHTSPNELLGYETSKRRTKRELVRERITGALDQVTDVEAEILLIQVEALAARAKK